RLSARAAQPTAVRPAMRTGRPPLTGWTRAHPSHCSAASTSRRSPPQSGPRSCARTPLRTSAPLAPARRAPPAARSSASAATGPAARHGGLLGGPDRRPQRRLGVGGAQGDPPAVLGRHLLVPVNDREPVELIGDGVRELLGVLPHPLQRRRRIGDLGVDLPAG